MRRYIIAGLLVWVPILVTVLVLRFLWEIIDHSVALIPEHFQPELLFGFNIPGFGIFISLLILLLTGIFAANFLGRKVVHFSEQILGQIPLVRSIYKAVKQSMQVIFSPTGRSFRQVVMIEYPRAGIWSLGFVTNEGDSYFHKMENPEARDTLTVFVPTTPNPTSGFLLFVPRQDVHFIDVPVDEALKTIISLGTAMDQASYPVEHVE